jgi:hypothetical protein
LLGSGQVGSNVDVSIIMRFSLSCSGGPCRARGPAAIIHCGNWSQQRSRTFSLFDRQIAG